MFLARLAKRKYIPAALLIITAAVYFPLHRAEFLLWDDYLHLYENPLMRGSFFSDLWTIWTQPYKGLYTPVLYTLWRAWAALVGVNSVWPYLLLNISVHTINGLLLFNVIGRIWDKLPVGVAFAAAVLFLVHPLQVESVSWASGFKELTWVTFALLAILFQEQKRPGLMVAMFLLAVLCKPTAVVLPLLLFVLAKKRSATWAYGLMAGSAVGIAWVTKSLQPDRFTDPVVAFGQRLYIALDALGFYIEKLVMPFPLTPDYGRRPSLVLASGWTPPAWLGLMMVIGGSYLIWKKNEHRAIAWAVIPILPVLGIVPFIFQNYSTVADRYVYFSIAGFSILLGSQLSLWRPYGYWILAALTVVYASLSRPQAEIWRANEAFFSRALKMNPNSFMAENNLGVLADSRGDRAQALQHFENSLAMNPRYDQAVKNYGVMLINTNRFEEAVEYYPHYLSLEPRWADLHLGYGIALLGLERFSEALVELKAAIDLEPENHLAIEKYAIALSLSGRHNESLLYFQQAVELSPGDTSYQFNLHHAREKAK